MDMNKFTEKTQQAIIEAQRLAQDYNHSQIDVEHLLAALLDQEDGVVPQVLSKLGIDTKTVQTRIQAELDKQPKAYGTTQVYMSQRLNQVQMAARVGAQSDNVTGVGWNFGLEQNDIEHGCIVARIARQKGATHAFFTLKIHG